MVAGELNNATVVVLETGYVTLSGADSVEGVDAGPIEIVHVPAVGLVVAVIAGRAVAIAHEPPATMVNGDAVIGSAAVKANG
jgi:hypothetical protein